MTSILTTTSIAAWLYVRPPTRPRLLMCRVLGVKRAAVVWSEGDELSADDVILTSSYAPELPITFKILTLKACSFAFLGIHCQMSSKGLLMRLGVNEIR